MHTPLKKFNSLVHDIHKIECYNDPLGQTTARPSVNICFVLFDFEWWGRTDGHQVITNGRACVDLVDQ